MRDAREATGADLIRVLDENDAASAEWAKKPRLANDALVELYTLMSVTRRVDREAIHLQRQGNLGVYSSSRGQEAAQVGSAYALTKRDWVFPAYREKGLDVVRGIDLGDRLHLERGVTFGPYDPAEHNMALPSMPVATQSLHAVGFALGVKLDKRDIAVLAYCGDGATSEGDWHEAMNFAGVMRLPLVMFVQNNGYAISLPFERQTAARALVDKAPGYGLAGVRCDGNDVLATWSVTHDALATARAGGGPTLIEAVTYRLESHTTADDSTRYRDSDEVATAEARDPIARLRRYLSSVGVLTDELEASVEEIADRRARDMRARVLAAPEPDPLEIFAHVYVDAPAPLRRQRAQLAAELDADRRGTP